MNAQPRIPDPETRKRSVERMRQVCRQLEWGAPHTRDFSHELGAHMV